MDSTMRSFSASSIPLGYIGMASESIAISIVSHIAVVSASATSVNMSSGRGGGATPLPSPSSTIQVLNTVLQNMGHLQLHLTSLASAFGQSFVRA